MIVVFAYTQMEFPAPLSFFVGFPLGFLTIGYHAAVGPFLTELFPTTLRGSGQGFCYNVGRGIGATFPALVGYFSAEIPLADAMAIFGIAGFAIVFAAALTLPETRGKLLAND